MAVFNSLTIGGINSLDYGIYITGEGVYDAPNRAVEMVEIHGRNGALILDKGHFENIEIKYPCGSFGEGNKTFEQRITEFKNAVLSLRGYQRLTDTYAADVYRLASCANGFEVAPVQGGKAGEFDLVFNCKPQRFLTSGETLVTVANNGTITNPTAFDAQPVIEVEGYGTLTFNGYEIDIENAVMGRIVTDSDVTLGANGYLYVPSELANQGDTVTVTGISASITGTVTGNCTLSAGTTSGGSLSIIGKSFTIKMSIPSFTYNIGTSNSSRVDGTFRVVLTTPDAQGYVQYGYYLICNYNSATNWITLNFSQSSSSSAIPEGVNVSLGSSTRFVKEVAVNSTVGILGHPTVIDCELGEAYKVENDSFISLNAYIDLGSDLPVLASGTNTFTKSNTITSLKVKPNWWKL